MWHYTVKDFLQFVECDIWVGGQEASNMISWVEILLESRSERMWFLVPTSLQELILFQKCYWLKKEEKKLSYLIMIPPEVQLD